MNVLLLGGGGREHAIAWKLKQSPKLERLWAAPGSDAIADLAEQVRVNYLDPSEVAAFVKERKVDLVFVGPEAPLEAGVSDAARAAGALVFGPSRECARLETSKTHAKDFMTRHGVPTARAKCAADAASAKAAAREFGGRCAVKADGLAGGKGVIVCGSVAEADAAVDALGATAAGASLVIEERLEGPEVTVMALVDGRGWAVLPFSQDHKRLLDGDAGPNTGGMGALAPARLGPLDWDRVKTEALDRTVAGLQKDRLDYRGALYVGLMLTPDGPRVLEYNARFGDPETQSVLPLLDADLLALAADCAAGRLAPGTLPAKRGACVGITLASPGYPDAPRPGSPIDLSAVENMADAHVFHAGTRRTSSGWTAVGGRVLTVVGLGADVAAARARAYEAVARVNAPGLFFRRDIAARPLGRALA
jgi:phosphoribosylamine--glycine ligase